jgi:desulfoferrodoxin (superoxide reductase-like protein)
VSRFVLTPKLIHPAACFHMNMVEGKIAAIAHCNVHGNWMTELDLQQKEH